MCSDDGPLVTADRIASIAAVTVPPRWIFVRVRTGAGLAGWGEAIVPKRKRSVLGAIADLTDVVAGFEADRIEDLWQRMHRGAFFRGGPILATAAAAIEQALWDIKGQRLGVAVHDLLGGRVRDRIRSYAWVAGDDPSDVVADTHRRVEQGFTAVKMNAIAQCDYIHSGSIVDGVDNGSTVDAVVARVGSLRREFGPDLGIAVDFHGRVHRGMAKTLLRELEPFRLMWVEEAAAPERDDLLPVLAGAAASTPLATGERLTSRWEFVSLLERRAVDIVQPDVSLTGLYELAKIAHLAEAHDVAVAPHCPNGPVSLAASLQVGYCCPNVVIQEQSGGLHYNTGYAGLRPGELSDYLAAPGVLAHRQGHFEWTDAPGLGVAIDESAVHSRAEDWHLPDPDWRYGDGRYAEW